MSGIVLFVYGSLLCGEPGFRLLRGARFLGRARTAPQFKLVDLGEYPAMLQGGAAAVAGELYEVGPATLAELDDYEGHPTFYQRALVALEAGPAAEAYLLGEEQAKGRVEVPSGDWRAYIGRRPAGARVYRVREASDRAPIPKDR